MTFITLYAREKALGEPGMFFAFFAAGIAVSRLVSGRIFDRHGPGRLVTSGLGAGSTGFLLLYFSGASMAFLFAASLIGICMGLVMPSLQAMANNVVDQNRRGAANATFITAFDTGIGGGAIILGFVARASSLDMVYLASAALMFLALLLFRLSILRYYEKRLLRLPDN